MLLVADVDVPEPPGDRRAALVRHVAADLHANDAVEGRGGRRQRLGGRRHHAPADGVGAQPVADLDRSRFAAPVQSAAAEHPIVVAGRARFGDQVAVVLAGRPALGDLGDERGGGRAVLIGPRHERAEVVAARLDRGLQGVDVAGLVPAQHDADGRDLDPFRRVRHRSIVAATGRAQFVRFRSDAFAQRQRSLGDLVGDGRRAP